MAQTGYTPISIYYSSTASNVPTAANLVQGELAINTNDGKLYYEDSSGVVRVLASKSTGSIGGSTTQIQYNSSGSLAGSANLIFDGNNLGVGTTLNSWQAAYRALQIGKTAVWWANSASDDWYIGNNYYFDGSLKRISTGYATEYAQYTGNHVWSTAGSSTAGSAVTFTQALAVGLNTSLALQGATSQSGTGITFPATQSASANANTLDDYEEGTWSPTITFGNASTGITYTTNEGFYTKIGSQVFLTGYIQLSSKGSATGYADIKGFPFTVQNASGANSAASLRFNNISFSGAFQGYAPVNTTQISLTQITLLGVPTDLTDTNFSNNSSIIFAVNYRV